MRISDTSVFRSPSTRFFSEIAAKRGKTAPETKPVQTPVATKPVATPVAWDPYPVSLRIRNWLEAFTLFQPALGQDAEFAEALCESLYAQARFLAHKINPLELG